MSKDVVVSAVPLLVHLRNPAAVLLAVVAITVNSVKRVLVGWARPHVTIERLKAVFPFVAYRDTASTIAWVGPNVRVVAPIFHLVPDAVDRSSCHSVA